MSRRRWAALFSLVVPLVLAAPAADAATYRDVPAGHAFATEIGWLSDQGVATGYADGTFRPGAPVLREQMAAFLYRFTYGGSNPPAANTTSGFRDVALGHTFKNHIRWLSSAGWATGYADGTFRPGAPVLREQMAAFLYRAAGSPSASALTCGFDDIPSSHAFAREICWLKSTGITTGYDNPDGTTSFRGSQPVLREQMAAFLYRFDQGRGRPTKPSATTIAVNWILTDTNLYRAQNGLRTLTLHPSMNTVAADWSKHMHDTCTFNHNPDYSSQIPSGWTKAAENIAAGQQYTDVVQAWIDSPGHRANLLGDFTHLGVGYYSGSNCYGRYFTQVFAKY
ncbi:MAG: S-layer homology domain-containing protein [Aeromicrobium sp.]|uniref:CAP and S-layer homology domain-containing protein n=1 Tax=Aeromicrobium sp. TaxID=1871063 RepID=UPI0039E5BF89